MKHLQLLGRRAKDKVTGYEGVITSICYDLYGCVMAVLTPAVDKDGGAKEGKWFDEKRLEVMPGEPVMPVPEFESIPGPEAKSVPERGVNL